jgi:hypothetical protein
VIVYETEHFYVQRIDCEGGSYFVVRSFDEAYKVDRNTRKNYRSAAREADWQEEQLRKKKHDNTSNK